MRTRRQVPKGCATAIAQTLGISKSEGDAVLIVLGTRKAVGIDPCWTGKNRGDTVTTISHDIGVSFRRRHSRFRLPTQRYRNLVTEELSLDPVHFGRNLKRPHHGQKNSYLS